MRKNNSNETENEKAIHKDVSRNSQKNAKKGKAARLASKPSLFGESTKRVPYLASSSPTPSPAGTGNTVDQLLLPPPLPLPLTLKEKRVLEFLEFYVRERGVSPTYQEICGHFGFASYNSVQRYLKQLEAKGYVRVPWGNQKRAIALLRSSASLQESAQSSTSPVAAKDGTAPMPPQFASEVLALPLLGRVAAGSPIEAYENDEFIDVPASLVRHADRTYALRVQGQSMIDDGILDGDVILVQRQSRAENGEIVVAVIQEEATVKRIYLHASGPQTVELRPANSTMKSMWFDPGEIQIRGVVVGLIRRF